jgi:hypothetical protein
MDTRNLFTGAIAALLTLTVVSSSSADPIKCQRDLAKASAKYVQGRAKALDKCEQGKTKGQFPPATNCLTDPMVTATFAKLDLKLSGSIAKACGGADKTCGSADDEPLGSIGWGSVPNCPDFESSGCTNAIGDCTDITTCLECIDNAAVDQAIDLYYAAFDSGQFGTNSAVNKCQQAIGKSTVKFLGARSKAMQKCWDARLKGLHTMTCPADGSGKTALLIQKAEAKKVDGICKACGGSDQTCDGNGDLTPGAIGFASSCPAVTTFASDSCGGPIASAAAIVDCVDCVTTFKTDCMDAVAVPGLVSPLPSNCNPGAPTTTSTSSPAPTSSSSTSPTPSTTSSSSPTPTTSSTSSPATTSSTSSSTSTATTSSTTSTTSGGGPTKFDFTATAGSGTCGNTFRDMGGVTPLKNLLCANLSLGGGLSQVPDNTTPSGSTNRFSLSCAGPSCTVGPVSPATAAYDCSATGCLFGTPLPISNAGLSVCVTNTFSAPASGTLDTGSGDVTLDFELNSATVLTGNPTQPCPICAVSVGGAACSGSLASPCTGVCDGSPNQGAACTTKNPNGLTSACPAPAAITGASRCYRGTNNNGTCSTGTNCPGGTCALFIGNIAVSLNPLTTGTSTLASAAGTFCPGQGAAQQGAFKDDICRTGPNSGKPCQTGTSEAVDAANCGAGGLCRPGSLNNYCTGGTNDGKGCVSAADCGTGGSCVRAGAIVQLIRETGVPAGALAINTPKPLTLASVFCVASTASPLVNANANLPGPGATSLVGTVTLLP